MEPAVPPTNNASLYGMFEAGARIIGLDTDNPEVVKGLRTVVADLTGLGLDPTRLNNEAGERHVIAIIEGAITLPDFKNGEFVRRKPANVAAATLDANHAVAVAKLGMPSHFFNTPHSTADVQAERLKHAQRSTLGYERPSVPDENIAASPIGAPSTAAHVIGTMGQMGGILIAMDGVFRAMGALRPVRRPVPLVMPTPQGARMLNGEEPGPHVTAAIEAEMAGQRRQRLTQFVTGTIEIAVGAVMIAAVHRFMHRRSEGAGMSI